MVLDGSASFQYWIMIFSGVGDAAQLHGQANPTVAVFSPDTEQAAQQHVTIRIFSQLAQTNILISAYGDKIRVMQNGWVV